MSLKQGKIKFEPRITLNHNICILGKGRQWCTFIYLFLMISLLEFIMASCSLLTCVASVSAFVCFFLLVQLSRNNPIGNVCFAGQKLQSDSSETSLAVRTDRTISFSMQLYNMYKMKPFDVPSKLLLVLLAVFLNILLQDSCYTSQSFSHFFR